MKQNVGIDFPIDLVYMWVDGNDPKWRERRSHYMGGAEACPVQQEARWIDNQELRYSLRSVEMYAPWINHIYIVTDNQCPKWLNVANPKITIVDHREILPTDALPLFNSTAIETCLHRIPGLSEHFIFGNDDMIFSAPVSPDSFFKADGMPIVHLSGQRFNRRKAERKGIYASMVLRMQLYIKELYGKDICHAPHHSFDAYRRSDFEQCIALMPEKWKATTYRRFRSVEDMQRSFIGYWQIVNGAEMRLVGRYDRTNGLGGAIKAMVTGCYASYSRCIPLTVKDFDKVLAKYNPLMICVNDGEEATDDDRRRMREFLDARYPNKSDFETL